MNKKRTLGLFGGIFLAVLLGIACYQTKREPELSRYTASFLDVFDTKTDIIGYSTDEESFKAQVAMLKDKLTYYNELYDIYNEYEGINNIKTINDNAGVAPVEVSKDIIDLLLFSKEMYEKTDGQINIAMGNVLKIWHNYRDEGIYDPASAKLPSMEELTEGAKHMDINQIIIDEAAKTVYLADAKMSIDVGSIGKGYAVQRLAEYAKEIGMDRVLLSVGGNICAVGMKLDGSKWRIGIQNPDLYSDSPYVKKVDITDCCVVTSGNYQRYYTVDGKRYCHIIDKDTLMPADYFASVSILTKESGVADALSTAIFNMPYEEGLAFVNSLPDTQALWIMHDGTIHYTEGFADYISAE